MAPLIMFAFNYSYINLKGEMTLIEEFDTTFESSTLNDEPHVARL
jgi:hypothetical protein